MTDIRQLIAEGNTEAALEYLLTETQAKRDLYDQAVLLSGRFETWQRTHNMGLDDNLQELHRINHALLELADRLHTPVYARPSKPRSAVNRTTLLVLVVLLIGIVGVVFSLWRGDLWPGQRDEETVAPPSAALQLKADLQQWRLDAPPMGAKCQMKIEELHTEVNDANTTLVRLLLDVKNIHDGWYPAQWAPPYFLLEVDGKGIAPDNDFILLNIDPGVNESCTLEFVVPNGARQLALRIRGHGQETVVGMTVH